MKLADLRRLAREGIEPGAGVASFEVEAEGQEVAFREDVQRLWDRIHDFVNGFIGGQVTDATLNQIRRGLIAILRLAHKDGVLRVPFDSIDGLQIELVDQTVDIVWPAAVRIFFQEEAERWGRNRPEGKVGRS